MQFLNTIENYFDNLRKSHEFDRALFTVATVVGLLFIAFHLFRLIYTSIQGLRLYVFSQLCCRGDWVKKYGKWALVTGSTDGIGLAMARELARRGHSIIVVARNPEKLSQTKASLEEEPNVGEVITVKIDLFDSSADNYEKIRGQIDPDNRDIGVLINNAGLFGASAQRFHNSDMEFMKNMVNVNVIANLYFTRMILPGMKERGKGLVINVSSGLAIVPVPFSDCYCATKAFVSCMSKTLQMEYAGYPIDIVDLTTGPVFTKPLAKVNKVTEPSLVTPTPETYARSALNAASTGIKQTFGFFMHAVLVGGLQIIESLGLLGPLSPTIVKLATNDNRLSPKCQRKRRVNPSTTP